MATSYTWIFNGNANWTTTADWSTAAVPGSASGDSVRITAPGASNIGITLNSALSNPLASLAISSPGTNNIQLSMQTVSLGVTGDVTFAQAGSGFTRISGSGTAGTLAVGGTISGAGTIVSSATTFALSAARIGDGTLGDAASSMVLGGSGSSSAVVTINLTGGTTSTASQISVAGGATVRLTAGTLKVSALTTASQSGTIQVSGGSLDVGGAIAASAAATKTLVVSGGTLNLSAGGTLGAGGVIIQDVAGGVLRVGGALTAGGTITFAAGNASSQTLFDDLGTALTGLTISGFAGTDQIRVAGASSYKVISGGGTTGGTIGALDSGGGTIEVLTVASGQTLAANNTVIGGGTLTASAACYLAGTKIRTATGEVAVDDLVIGDMLVTADGGVLPIRWIGQRAYLARLVNEHHRAGLMPIRISAGALADNIPARDLFVSPEHMMALDGVLVAAHNLVNGSTITRFEAIDVVKYFHIELDHHSVIFAEGAASESYLDTGNRNMFTNVLDYAELGMPVGSTVPCLPIVSEGPALSAIRAGNAERAAACGFTVTEDADLHLLVDGAPVYPSVINGHSFGFDIAQSAGDVRIMSRSAVPAEVNPDSADRRKLGVAVAGLTLRGNGLSIDVLAGEKLLVDGFYPADAGHRWTNGAAALPTALLALMDGSFSVTVQLVGTGMRYPVADQGDVVAIASARGPRGKGAQRLVA